jgi:hypothetical protein
MDAPNGLIQLMLSRADDGFSRADQRTLGLLGFDKRDDRRSFLLGLFVDGINKYRETKLAGKVGAPGPIVGAFGDGTIMQMILDFIRELEPGTVKEFIKAILEYVGEFIKMIVAL